MANSTIRDKTPYFELPNTSAQKEIIKGPKKSANFPKISKNPKYSLDSFLGTILPNWDRESA